MVKPNKGGSFINDTPKEIIKEVCCCSKSQNGNLGSNSFTCVRKKAAGGKNEATGQTEELFSKQSDLKALAERKFWKHILLKVKQRKRLENGAMGNVCQAMNIVTGEKRALLVDPKLIDDQDMAGLEQILKDKVRLSPQGSSIYI